jgi:multidrug transporter EmrE-like cation transporter
MSNIILAICLGILSYSMLNIGMGLQKKGAATLPKIEQESFGRNIKNFFTNKVWVIGFILVQSQWVLLTLALEMGSLSIVTPLMSVGMIALVIFSYFYLKEPISKVEGAGIVAIVVGIVLSGITNVEKGEQETLEVVLDCFANTFGIIYLAVIFVFSVVLILLSILRKFANADVLFGIAAGITDGLGAIFLKAYMGGADFKDASVIQAAALRWEWWVLFVLMIIFNATATSYLQVA